MDFGQAFSFYYQTVLDATTFIAYFFVAAGLAFLLWERPTSKKNILKIAISFVVTYAICIVFSSFMFALANITKNQYAMQIIFALSLPIIVGVFCLIFARSRKLHRFIKTSI